MRRTTLAALVLSSIAAAAWACGSEQGASPTFPPIDEDASPDVTAPPFPPTDAETGNCTNLECKQVVCPPGSAVDTTTIAGKVYDPRGVNPLYNVVVYVPNGTVQEIDDSAGVTCDRCNGAFVTGSPLVSDVTKSDGSFTLKNVPVGVEIPIVVQLGKWRRTIKLPAVDACKVTSITDPQTFRMPRNRSEGHLPKMAIALGGADPFECLLRKIGIDDAEFTLPSDAGRVALYRGYQYSGDSATEAAYAFGPNADQRFPPVDTLWGNEMIMRRSDVTLFPCEGTPINADKGANLKQTQATYDNLRTYLNAGGREFVTHYSKTMIEGHRPDEGSPTIDIPSHYGAVGTFRYRGSDRSDAKVVTNASGTPTSSCLEASACPAGPSVAANDTLLTNIDGTFPKGLAFKEWLVATQASTTAGVLPVTEWRHDLEAANTLFAQPWITADTRSAWPGPSDAGGFVGASPTVQHITFNTPLDAGFDDAGAPNHCGKVVFSDFHVALQARDRTKHFPASCGDPAAPMTPQEKALEFMLFDLAACIQKEDAPPPTAPK